MRYEKCPGGIPTEVIQDITIYKLRLTGKEHTLPGRCLCPTCGRNVAYFGLGKEVRSHKKGDR